METKLITRRGCGGSVSTPSAVEGRLFIKSHVSRVPRRPINSPWRFLLWPRTNLIHISCRSTSPPSPRFLAAATRLSSKHSQYSIGPRAQWHFMAFLIFHPSKRRSISSISARVWRGNEFSSKARCNLVGLIFNRSYDLSISQWWMSIWYRSSLIISVIYQTIEIFFKCEIIIFINNWK